MCPTSERYHHHRSGYRTGLVVIEERHVYVGLDFLTHRATLCGQEATVPHLSPTTLTTDEQRLILRATVGARLFRSTSWTRPTSQGVSPVP